MPGCVEFHMVEDKNWVDFIIKSKRKTIMTTCKVGLALGSGSSRGWAHIGGIEALFFALFSALDIISIFHNLLILLRRLLLEIQ